MPPAESSTSPGRSRVPQLRQFAAGVLILCLAACASRQPAPVEERSSRPAPPAAAPAVVQGTPAPKTAIEPDWRPKTYTVKRGDTLYAIALDHGLDYRELAAWNNIENVNLIRTGQVLRLAAPAEPATAGAPAVQTAPLKSVAPVVAGDASAAPSAPSAPAAAAGSRNTETYKTQPKAIKEAYSEQALRDVQRAAAAPPPAAAATAPPAIVNPAPPPEPAPPVVVARADPKPAPEPADGDEKVDWSWPARGRIVTGFSEAANLKGIDIAGASGQPVAASAGGKVVYAGTGLRGYGKLIIVKHNATYLSAYAHNKEILVKEGQQVAKGQKIAEMGNTDADQVKLHFEIRRHGKPVDPLRYLPPA
jgi:lipoprotein NlpD